MFGILKLFYFMFQNVRKVIDPNLNPLRHAPIYVRYIASILLFCVWPLAFILASHFLSLTTCSAISRSLAWRSSHGLYLNNLRVAMAPEAEHKTGCVAQIEAVAVMR
jgi:hypothetical protein